MSFSKKQYACNGSISIKDRADVYYFLSKSKKDDGLKHWLKKGPPLSYDYNARLVWFRQQLKGSYLSRIMHKILPHTPKDKLCGDYGSISRLYPLDKTPPSTITDIMRFNALSIAEEPFEKLDGLLLSTVFSIIINNKDFRLKNLSAHRVAGSNVYKVGVFDLEFAFNDHEDLGSKDITEEWLESVVRGTGTASGKISVAEALLETMADFGIRGTEYYRGVANKGPLDSHKEKFINSLERELSAIDENHNIALLKTFKNLLDNIKSYEPGAYIKTNEDSVSKCRVASNLGVIGEELPVLRSVLIEYVGNVEELVRSIETKLEAEGVIPSVVAVSVEGAGGGSAGAAASATHSSMHKPCVSFADLVEDRRNKGIHTHW